MPPMTNSDPHTDPEAAPAKIRPDTDEKNWAEIYDRLRSLAFRRSSPMLAMDDAEDERFDCGVRSLRALMGSAEIAHRLKQYDEKEKTPDGEDEGDPLTDGRIRDVKRRVIRQIERIEKEDQEAAGGRSADPGEDRQAHRRGSDAGRSPDGT